MESEFNNLCDILNNQSLDCPVTNCKELVQGWKNTIAFLRHDNDENLHLEKHIMDCYKRYNMYLKKVKFSGSFLYLDFSIMTFLDKVDSVKNSKLVNINNYSNDILRVAYFIDYELLTCLGVVTCEI